VSGGGKERGKRDGWEGENEGEMRGRGRRESFPFTDSLGEVICSRKAGPC